MEIERKWLVSSWPEGLENYKSYQMRQGYVTVHPTVRIREEAMQGGDTRYVLCFKTGGGLSREEVESDITPELFADIEHRIIQKPLIAKERRDYPLPDGRTLEVSQVDKGQPTEFWYAEVEYETEAQALAWTPASCGLEGFLTEEVTNTPGQSMGAYWKLTRMR